MTAEDVLIAIQDFCSEHLNEILSSEAEDMQDAAKMTGAQQAFLKVKIKCYELRERNTK